MKSFIEMYSVECGDSNNIKVSTINLSTEMCDNLLAKMRTYVWSVQMLYRRAAPWICITLPSPLVIIEVPFRSNLVMYKMYKDGIIKSKRKNIEQYWTSDNGKDRIYT